MCPIVSPNFDDATSVAKEGIQFCRIKESQNKTSQTGNPYVNWKLQAEDGRTLYYNTPITGRASGMFKHFIHAAGEPGYEKGPYNTDQLTGKIVKCDLRLKEVMSQGQLVTVYEVKAVLKSDQPVVGREPGEDDFS